MYFTFAMLLSGAVGLRTKISQIAKTVMNEREPGPAYEIDPRRLDDFTMVEKGKVYFQDIEDLYMDKFGVSVDEYWDILYPQGKVEQWSSDKRDALKPWTKMAYINLHHVGGTSFDREWLGESHKYWGKPIRLMNMENLRRARLTYWNKIVGTKLTLGKDLSKVIQQGVSIANVLFESDQFIDPHFVDQGDLGDCWLLSAVSLMGQRKGSLKALFQSDQHSVQNNGDAYGNVGYYTIRLWNQNAQRGHGQWELVDIDDYVPVVLNDDGYPQPANVQTGDLIHDPQDSSIPADISRRHIANASFRMNHVIWPIVLEKAWAKWQWSGEPERASYLSLDTKNQGGLVSMGMIAMLGMPIEVHKFERQRKYWKHQVLDFDKVWSRYDDRQWTYYTRYLKGFYAESTWNDVESLTPHDLIRQHLQPAGDAGYPMTCDKDGEDSEVTSNTFVGGHAYSLTIGSPKRKLPRINVRNPWGVDNRDNRANGGDTIMRHWDRVGKYHHGLLREFNSIVVMKRPGFELPGFSDAWVDGLNAPASNLRNVGPSATTRGNAKVWELNRYPGGNLYMRLPLDLLPSESSPVRKRPLHSNESEATSSFGKRVRQLLPSESSPVRKRPLPVTESEATSSLGKRVRQ